MLTGTAWNFFVISQHILGIQPDYARLVVNPCISRNLAGLKVTRKFRGIFFQINIQNPYKISKGVKELWVDGALIEGNKIPVQQNDVCAVTVIMG